MSVAVVRGASSLVQRAALSLCKAGALLGPADISREEECSTRPPSHLFWRKELFLQFCTEMKEAAPRSLILKLEIVKPARERTTSEST